MDEPNWTDQIQLRPAAEEIIAAALKAVDPKRAVEKCITRSDHCVSFSTETGVPATVNLDQVENIYVIGGGKAGAPMVSAVLDLLGDHVSCGIVAVKTGHGMARSMAPVRIIEAGHPIPDRAGLEAANAIRELLSKSGSKDIVIALLSGGASALLNCPRPPISIEDMQQTTQALLKCGATIVEINTIRKHCSAIKGGQLASMAAPSRLISLILSDVVGDPLDIIASGPTVPDPSTFADAAAVIDRYAVQSEIPVSVQEHIARGIASKVAETPKPGELSRGRVDNFVIGNNAMATRAAAARAEQLGFGSMVLGNSLEGEARQIGRIISSLVKGIHRDEILLPGGISLAPPCCLIIGGEATVTVMGTGRGGRNQETALATAMDWPTTHRGLVACVATDGTDGPCDAAGAFADGTTCKRAIQKGLNPTEFLKNNDAYHFFAHLDDLIKTGPTRTNVNDFCLILIPSTASDEQRGHRDK